MSEPLPISVTDPDGREVLLTAARWAHIMRADGHPELEPYRDVLPDIVRSPDHRSLDPIKGRERFWRQAVGPSRWLRVVVDFTTEPASIVTAFADRRDPQDWKP